MDNDQGSVRDIAEKLKRGEITCIEAKKELYRRRLGHHQGRLASWSVALWNVGLTLCFALMYVPTALWVLRSMRIFSVEAPLLSGPKIVLPSIVHYVVGAFVAFGLFVTFYASWFLSKRGGLGEGDETVLFVREGPYKVMRHPIAFGMVSLFLFLPTILSWIPYFQYTPLTVICQLAMLLGLVTVGQRGEDQVNVKKWGDEYRQYMKEVPTFNFIRGLWNLRKKGKRKR